MTARGFIALTSVLIMSVILLFIIIGMSMRTLYARFNVLDDEFKAQSRVWAESCRNIAQLRLLTRTGYVGEETITFGNGWCTIGSIASKDGEVKTIVSAEYHHAFTALLVTLNADLSVVSEKEIHNTSP